MHVNRGASHRCAGGGSPSEAPRGGHVGPRVARDARRRDGGGRPRLAARNARSGPAAASRRTELRAPVTTAIDRRRQVAAFYAEHEDHLRRIVVRRVAAGRETIEDACQHAWATLLRIGDIALDCSGVAWLAAVAIREGWRLASTRREVPVGAMRPGTAHGDELREPPATQPEPGERAIARAGHIERVADLRALKRRERRELFLHALGYSYDEIAELTGSTYTAVNRRLSEGRAQLRRLELERRATA